jgi:hypothetical protein
MVGREKEGNPPLLRRGILAAPLWVRKSFGSKQAFLKPFGAEWPFGARPPRLAITLRFITPAIMRDMLALLQETT